MKITVLGGSGLIGSKLVNLLRQQGHDVVAASLASERNCRFWYAHDLQIKQQEDVMSENKASGKPTIVLVHGAFADSSGWNEIISTLLSLGYPVVAASNPLRSSTYDAGYVASILASITGPIVLVGHSYGGMVISGAAKGNPKVKALVYICADAPTSAKALSTWLVASPAVSSSPTSRRPCGRQELLQGNRKVVQVVRGRSMALLHHCLGAVQYIAHYERERETCRQSAGFLIRNYNGATDLGNEQRQLGTAWFSPSESTMSIRCAQRSPRGVELLNGPADRLWGVRTASFVDPGGHIWKIAE
jgi:pimeloyl-ACP methyl ester carboxylesterase